MNFAKFLITTFFIETKCWRLQHLSKLQQLLLFAHKQRITIYSNICKLTHFTVLISFYTPWKQQKTYCFLMFSEGIERDQWHEMDETHFIPTFSFISICSSILQHLLQGTGKYQDKENTDKKGVTRRPNTWEYYCYRWIYCSSWQCIHVNMYTCIHTFFNNSFF